MARYIKRILICALIFGSASVYGENLDPENTGGSREVNALSVRAARQLRGEDVDAGWLQRQIKDMARVLQLRFSPGMPDSDRVDILNQYFFEEQGFQSDRSRLFEGTLEGLVLDRVLTSRKGNCLSLSLVYLMVARELDLDVRAVVVPRHMFVRFVDGEEHRNIETTDRGANKSDAYYQSFFTNGPARGSAGRELTGKELFAVYSSNLAIHYNLAGQHEQALAMLNTAAVAFPDHAGIQTNLGNVYEHSGRIREAYAQYKNSLTVDPYICETHHNLGLLHFIYTKDHVQARRHGRAARQLGCRLHPQFQKFMERQ